MVKTKSRAIEIGSRITPTSSLLGCPIQDGPTGSVDIATTIESVPLISIFGSLAAETHCAQADGGNVHAWVTKLYIVHSKSLLFV